MRDRQLSSHGSNATRLEAVIGAQNFRRYRLYAILLLWCAGVFLLLGVFFAVSVQLNLQKYELIFDLEMAALATAVGLLFAGTSWAIVAYRGIAKMYGVSLLATWDLPMSKPHMIDDWAWRHGGNVS